MRQITLGASIAALALCAVAADPVAGEQARAGEQAVHVFRIGAAEAFEQGMGAWDVRMDDSGKAMILYNHVLFEDDGPGISSDAAWLKQNRAPIVEIGGAKRVKKVLHLDRPEAIEARLYAPRGVQVELNGSPVETNPRTHYPEVPTALLRPGDNEVVLSAPADKPVELKVAKREDILRNAPDRADNPPRSFKSDDGGKSWQVVPEGEIMLRLHLVRYVPEGSVILPVLDMAEGRGAPLDPTRDPGEDAAVLLSNVTVRSLTLKADAEEPGGTAVALAVRTGPGPVYEKGLWTDWQPAESANVPAGHRWLQVRATLTSKDPTKTPRLKGVAIEVRLERDAPPAWAKGITLGEQNNEVIRYTSLPFAYEDPNHPKMVALREKYKLDEVVADGKTELEKLVILRNWVAQQWHFKAPSTYYPAWDADDIMTHKIGFCVQFAITYMQCAISLGYQARFVFGNNYATGHEVCEVWSNEYGKWVYMDCSGNFHCIDPRTAVPMSLLEVRDVILRTYYGDKPANWRNKPKETKTSDEIAICHGLDMTPTERKRAKDGKFPVITKWMYLRAMPRNNFYAQPYPVPVCQGAHWDYSDFWCYQNHGMETEWEYRHFTGRRSDFDWTINQVSFAAKYGKLPNTVDVRMGSVTPYLEKFLVRIDGGEWKASEPVFTWTLHPGKNRVEMRTRNTSGVEGIVSFLEINLAAAE